MDRAAQQDPVPAVSGGCRPEVGTSAAPFASVREAVDRFGHLISRMFAPPDEKQNLPEEQTVQLLEKELSIKERETLLDVLKEFESTKKTIADFKLEVKKDSAYASAITGLLGQTESSVAEPKEKQPENVETDADVEEKQQETDPGSVLMELEQAKASLNRTKTDLAAIRASIELLRNGIAKEKVLVERSREKVCSNTSSISSLEDELKDLRRRREDPAGIFIEIKRMTSEIERLRTAANASKSEAVMLAAEIEQTKASIGTAEVRCLAAKKMKKEARAAEALALTEIKCLLSSEASAEDFKDTGVNLSVEEYADLASKAQEAGVSSSKKIAAAMVQVDETSQSKSDLLRKLEEATLEVQKCRMALKESLERIDVANRGKLATEEAIHRWRSDIGHNLHAFHDSPKLKNAAHYWQNSQKTDIVEVSKSLKPSLSIGQILNMKLMGSDQMYNKTVWDNTSETSNSSISLGQIINRRHVYGSDSTSDKKFSGMKKKFAFTVISVFLAKQTNSKKKRANAVMLPLSETIASCSV